MADLVPFQAHFADGLTAQQHDVEVSLAADRLHIDVSGDTLEAPLRWALKDIRALGEKGYGDQLVLTRHRETDDEAPRDPARLMIDDPLAIAWFKSTRPHLYRADLPKGTGWKIARNSVLALSAVAILLLVILPAMANTLARLIPLEREVAFGKSVTRQMERLLGGEERGQLVCDGPDGRAALDKMTERLIAGAEIPYDLDVNVFNHPMVNAFAAPGGQVVLLRGLLERASGPDAVAGVLAHEIGHVVARDPTRAALRTFGSAGILSLVIGDFTGGAVIVALGEQALNSSYSREAEEEADAFALATLNRAKVSSEGFAAFFDALLKSEGRLAPPEILSTHPNTQGRAQLAWANTETQGDTTPILSHAEWENLKSMCGAPEPADTDETPPDAAQKD